MPVPDGFDAWVMRMLQKSPSDRYQRAADASWGLHLLGDPTELVGRQTVSLFPSHHETDDLTMSHQKVGATAKQAVKVYDPDPTLMDRPDTTQLLLDELKPAHITQSSLQWEPESEDGILAELGNLAERMVPPLPYHWRPTKKSMQSPKLLGAGLGLFGLRAIPVVGRDELKDKLWNTLKTVRQSGALQVVILQGPAGTGKTCLAHWMARRAHEVGSAEVFFAQHSPTGGSAMGLPRMIARQLRCVGLTHAETEDRLREVLKPLQMGDDLAAQGLTEVMLPSIKPEQSRAIQFSTAEQKFGLIHRYLQEASRDRPALVVLDDVQWGTEALALTLHLIEKDRARPLKGLLLLTVRDEALPNRPVEDAMLEALTSHQQSQLLEISPLNAEHTDQLVRELLYLNEHLSDQIEARSGGNPLFAVQLIGDLVDGDKLKFAADGFELRRGALLKIPDDIHSLWMSRLATRTGAQNLEVMKSLEAAAALGQTVDLEEWTTICGFMDLEVSPALVANLLASGLIVREEGGWSFCHQLLRESVERHARESFRWIPVNKSCLQMLLARHPQGEFPVSERLATHYLACGDRPAALTPLLVSARARIDSSDFEMALGHLREFDKTVDLLASAENRRVESWLLRGELQIQRGQYDEALRLAEISAIEGRKAGRTDLIALALRIEGTAQLQTGQLKQAERTLRRARDHYDELNDLTGLANATLALARVSEFEGDLDVALSLLKEVEVLFQQSSHTMGLARTYNAFGDVYRHLGDDENAKDYSHKAMKLFERLGNQIGVADCINDLSEIARNQNQLEAALNSCEQALAMYEALGADQSMFVRINLGRILQDMSRYAEARQVFQEIKVHFQTTKQWGLLTEVSIYSLLSLAALDEWDEWNVYLESAKDLVTRTGVWGPEFENLLTRVKHAIERKGRMLESDALDSLMARGQTVTS